MTAAAAAFVRRGTLGRAVASAALNGDGETLENAVQLVGPAAGADDAAAVLFRDRTFDLEFLAAGVAFECIERHGKIAPFTGIERI